MSAESIRKDFPFFKNTDVVYLDSAATSQKPQIVLDSIDDYYKNYCANIHRASHDVGDKATARYEQSRKYIAEYIGKESIMYVVLVGSFFGLIATIFLYRFLRKKYNINIKLK